MICPIDKNGHNCEAADCYIRWPMDYPESPCKKCNQHRINELEEKIRKQEQGKENETMEMENSARPAPDRKQLYDALCWWCLGEHYGYELPKNNQYIVHDFYDGGKPILNDDVALKDMLLILEKDLKGTAHEEN